MNSLDVIAGLIFCLGMIIAAFPVNGKAGPPTKRQLLIGEVSLIAFAFYIGCRVGEFWS